MVLRSVHFALQWWLLIGAIALGLGLLARSFGAGPMASIFLLSLPGGILQLAILQPNLLVEWVWQSHNGFFNGCLRYFIAVFLISTLLFPNWIPFYFTVAAVFRALVGSKKENTSWRRVDEVVFSVVALSYLLTDVLVRIFNSPSLSHF